MVDWHVQCPYAVDTCCTGSFVLYPCEAEAECVESAMSCECYDGVEDG
jgi:hypothetical protein